MLINKEQIKKAAKEELIKDAKAKFMEEYFLMNQELKTFPTKKGEEYEAIVKRIEELEHNMECLSTLNTLLNSYII